MCGILGLYSINQQEGDSQIRFTEALKSMVHRGPDDYGIYKHERITLGHRRLSIIDLSNSAHQPMHDPEKRYTIVFNGEIFNFRELRNELIADGRSFHSSSDTEVLLQLYIKYEEKCLSKLNGFFAFSIYDHVKQTLFIARDRYGIKPLYYYFDHQQFIFSSEIQSLKMLGIPAEIDYNSLLLYFQLNYIPVPYSIYRDVYKLQPGHYILLQTGNGKYPPEEITEKGWYEIPYTTDHQYSESNYQESCTRLFNLMDAAVERRLISDVPLGAFLSGGVDSSIITALAARHTKELHTYSIGFKDEPAFDETVYSQMVANHCNTKHTAFILQDDELVGALPEMSRHFDEPFADSSALAVYILSKETRKHVTVSLSGDGSDELFGGYRKHRAEWLIQKYKLTGKFAPLISFGLKAFSGSRQSKLGNKLRQLHRFAEGAVLSTQERYWRWCAINSEENAFRLLHPELQKHLIQEDKRRKNQLTQYCKGDYDFNKILLNDCKLVLPGDMLTKVDLMSMANSLEVRVPFLDVEVVDFAFSLPASFKINKTSQKRILRDSFGHLLPVEIFQRSKQGFEIPLSNWFKGSLNKEIKHVLADDKIRRQGIFNPQEVKNLLQLIDSKQQGEATARVWALLVFQYWWDKQQGN
ncbi:MAG: asparagine synthase (glutamine-hydrolyzing) [Bacteroidetes bacterium]|nr:asparagine synthase (glutamine-hydrolyzing) [Bacteroidota bacterium]